MLQRFHEAMSLQNALVAIGQAKVSRLPINSCSLAYHKGLQAIKEHCNPWQQVSVLWVQASAAACGRRACLSSDKAPLLICLGSCSQSVVSCP